MSQNDSSVTKIYKFLIKYLEKLKINVLLEDAGSRPHKLNHLSLLT